MGHAVKKVRRYDLSSVIRCVGCDCWTRKLGGGRFLFPPLRLFGRGNWAGTLRFNDSQSLRLLEKGRHPFYLICYSLQLRIEIVYSPILVCQKLLFIFHLTFQVLDFCSKVLSQPIEGRLLCPNDLFSVTKLGFQRSDLCAGILSELLHALSFTTRFCFGLLNRRLQLGYLLR